MKSDPPGSSVVSESDSLSDACDADSTGDLGDFVSSGGTVVMEGIPKRRGEAAGTGA